jgi:hypothetical protein
MSVPPPKRENLLFNIVCNIAVPSVVLTYGSKAAWLGPKGALIVALAFPLGSILPFHSSRCFEGVLMQRL